MEKRRFGTKKVFLVAIAVLVVGGIGYVVGLAKAGYDMQTYLLKGNAGLLMQRIDFLAELRAGETAEVTRRLQSSIDNLVLMSACRPGRGIGDFDPKKLPTFQLSALKLARAYADAVPQTPLSEKSQQVLRQVDPTDTKYCSPALRALQEAGSKK